MTQSRLVRYPAGGGPNRSVAWTTDTLAADVITTDRDLGDTESYPGLSGKAVSRGRHRVIYIKRNGPIHLFRPARYLARHGARAIREFSPSALSAGVTTLETGRRSSGESCRRRLNSVRPGGPKHWRYTRAGSCLDRPGKWSTP